MRDRSRETGNIAGRALRDALVIVGILAIVATVRVSFVPANAGGDGGRIASPANLVAPAVRAMEADPGPQPPVNAPSASECEDVEYVTFVGLSG